jgi:hypothetical protein
MADQIARIAAFRSKKGKDARTLAECVRAAKELVFVASDGSEAMISDEMRELMAEALDLLADQERL